MRTVFHRIFALVMVLFFLASTSGIVLATHICLSDSHKSVALFSNKGCCPQDEKSCGFPVPGEQALNSKCCVTDFSFHKIDATSVVVISATKMATELCSVSFPQFTFSFASSSSPEFFTAHDPPPSGSGRQLLLSLQRLQV
jgi:hypothetical protein